MFRNFFVALMTSAALLSASSAAIVLEFSPTSQTVIVGDTASIAVSISGLGSLSSPSLATFDIDISFDPSILSFSSAIFGNQLDLFGLGDINVATPGLGNVNLFELSLESVADLDSLQMANFVLAILSFNVTNDGTSRLDVSVNTLGDSVGNPLTATLANGSITGLSTPISIPSTLMLVSLGLLALALSRAKVFAELAVRTPAELHDLRDDGLQMHVPRYEERHTWARRTLVRAKSSEGS